MKKPYFTKWQKIGLVVLVLGLLAYKGVLDWPRQILLPDGYGEKWPTHDTEGISRDHGPITDAWNCADRAPSIAKIGRTVLKPITEYSIPEDDHTSTVTLAPDGETLAIISSAHNKESRLLVRTLSNAQPTARYSLPTHRFKPASANWSADSKTIWITAAPKYSAEADGPVVAFRATDGKLKTLGQINSGAGRMKSLVFADNGKAFGLLDTGGARGGMHVILDTDAASILDLYPQWKGPSVEYDGSYSRSAPSPTRPADDAIVGADGRVRVFSRVGEWFTWTQGRTPKMLANPFPDREFAFSRLFASRNETRILYMRPLSPTYRCLGGDGACATGPAVDSILASSHDFETGKAKWAIRGCAAQPVKNYPFPAVQPNGRYALLGLPTLKFLGTAQIGVVDLDEGKIIQRLPAPGDDYSVGFSKGGAIAWTYGDGKFVTYSIDIR